LAKEGTKAGGLGRGVKFQTTCNKVKIIGTIIIKMKTIPKTKIKIVKGLLLVDLFQAFLKRLINTHPDIIFFYQLIYYKKISTIFYYLSTSLDNY